MDTLIENYKPILISYVVCTMLSFQWFSNWFDVPFCKYTGISQETVQKAMEDKKMNMGRTFAIEMALKFTMILLYSYLSSTLQLTESKDFLLFSAFLWIGNVFPNVLSNAVNENKSLGYVCLISGEILVLLLATALIFAFFRTN